MQPFVKWVGGKRQLLDELVKRMPANFNRYFEPFVGGGALFFRVCPKDFIINDKNLELITTYKCLTNEECFESLCKNLEYHKLNHSEKHYLEVRHLDRERNFESLPNDVKGARLIYLNKSCFNGLYRVNSKGYFNVPSGKKKQVNIGKTQNLVNIFNYLKRKESQILNVDFEVAIASAKSGDFVYFDPPYDADESLLFTSYTKEAFGKNEQIRLSEVFKKLNKKGVFLMMSNSNTKLVNDLYSEFNIQIVQAKRLVSADNKGRKNVEEVIITNY
ncbi:adenine-specific DNA methyltransferase [Mycoplasmopsis columbinasalis]|uniref:Site-specific DNA-methyltransferase (adenine-specific) n=2 Tax=Mycoplasmopsis columbinasalis TaxID=114880 RepID=A0A449BAU2_9BACT|nr:adenine-specific DNA methyltransferase [Mycoplasmopsis columbinasalis]